MEPVIFDQSPLAEYLKDEGAAEFLQGNWAVASASSVDDVSSVASDPDHSPILRAIPLTSSRAASRHSSISPSPRASFAPTGRPAVRSRFRTITTSGLRVNIPEGDATKDDAKWSKRQSLQDFKRKFSAMVASTITLNDNAKFLEQFRYVIVASQLLSGHGFSGAHMMSMDNMVLSNTANTSLAPSTAGLFKCVFGVWVVTVVINWLVNFQLTWRQSCVMIAVLAACGTLGVVYVRQRWLQHQKDLALTGISEFVPVSNEFDSAIGAAVALVQEVELVSRGYRLSTPLPPISRIEDRSQTRKCVRLRKALRMCYADVLKTYKNTTTVFKRFSDPTSLEKYYDVYDISDFDVTEALAGYVEDEFDDVESLRTFKIFGARFSTLRKIFLCALLALDAIGDGKDLLPWTTAAEAIKQLNTTTREAYERVRAVLVEAETFPLPPTPTTIPLTPSKERWRAQLRKLGSLSSGIRGLQAKMHILREESDKVLDESFGISEIGPTLLTQYESLGADLKELTRTWEEGKTALAQGIDRTEKRLSSMSTAISPTISWSGLTTVNEGGTDEAFRALTGESPPISDAESEKIYEAVAMPRPRSTFTREQRIAKMKEDREQREQARDASEASRGMLRELEMVIKPRMSMGTPRTKPSSRVVSI